MKKEDEKEIKVGDKFEYWEVLDDTPVQKNGKGRYYYLCKCTKCNETISLVRKSYLLGDGYKQCKDCWYIELGERRRSRRGNSIWEDEKERHYFYNIKGRAKRKKISLNITPKYIFDLLKKQENKCFFLGKEISFDSDEHPSLDRIDSSLGYIKGNVQWVTSRINRMKGDMTTEEFYQTLITIYNYKNLKELNNATDTTSD